MIYTNDNYLFPKTMYKHRATKFMQRTLMLIQKDLWDELTTHFNSWI